MQGAKLRAAAAAGRTSEVTALLDLGAPVDASDATGKTALMQSVEGDHPDTAALLVRRGADLERKDRRGSSARDLARAKGDLVLSRALGLGPDGAP